MGCDVPEILEGVSRIQKMIQIDFFETLRLLDSCFGGSTGVCIGFIRKVIDRYDSFLDEEKTMIYKRLFKAGTARTEMDYKLLARFYPDNQYTIETKNEGELRAYKFNDKYFVNAELRIVEDEIVKVEKK
jgi:hypothetical protein